MRGMWRTGLGLSLGLLVGSASAEEVVWRPVGAPPAAVKPADPPPARPAAAALGRPVAALGKPVAAGAGAPAPFDPLVRPVSFSAGAPAQPVFRGYSPDVPRPMPTGPALGSDQPPPQKLHPPKEVDPIDPPPPSVATVPTPHGPFQTIVPNYGGGPECCPDCGPDFCGVCGPEDCCGCDGCCCCNGCGRCGWCGFGNCCDGTRRRRQSGRGGGRRGPRPGRRSRSSAWRWCVLAWKHEALLKQNGRGCPTSGQARAQRPSHGSATAGPPASAAGFPQPTFLGSGAASRHRYCSSRRLMTRLIWWCRCRSRCS